VGIAKIVFFLVFLFFLIALMFGTIGGSQPVVQWGRPCSRSNRDREIFAQVHAASKWARF